MILGIFPRLFMWERARVGGGWGRVYVWCVQTKTATTFWDAQERTAGCTDDPLGFELTFGSCVFRKLRHSFHIQLHSLLNVDLTWTPKCLSPRVSACFSSSSIGVNVEAWKIHMLRVSCLMLPLAFLRQLTRKLVFRSFYVNTLKLPKY